MMSNTFFAESVKKEIPQEKSGTGADGESGAAEAAYEDVPAAEELY